MISRCKDKKGKAVLPNIWDILQLFVMNDIPLW